MSWFKKFWLTTNKPEPKVSNTDTYIDISISLNKNKQIDFSISLDDKIDNKTMNIIDYSMLCAEFLNTVVSKEMKEDTINILNQQIKTPENSLLINNIVSIIKIINKNKSHTNSSFIKPTEVFTRFNI